MNMHRNEMNDTMPKKGNNIKTELDFSKLEQVTGGLGTDYNGPLVDLLGGLVHVDLGNQDTYRE